MGDNLLIWGVSYVGAGNSRGRMREEGFTLIEVMIAMLVFVIGLLAVCSMLLSGIQGDSIGRQYTEASALAVERIETLMKCSYDDDALKDTNGNGTVGVNNTGAAADNSMPDASGQYTISWNVAEDDLVDHSKTVSVIVGWGGIGTGRTVAMRQVIAKNL